MVHLIVSGFGPFQGVAHVAALGRAHETAVHHELGRGRAQRRPRVQEHVVGQRAGGVQGVAHNPTTALIDFLRSETNLAERLGTQQVDLCVLDVSARAADTFAAQALASALNDADGPTVVVVHLGVDAGCRAPTIALERCAYNEGGFRCPDQDGCVLGPDHAPCPAAPLGACLTTGLDLERLRARVEAWRDARREGAARQRYEVRISQDAGRFLCNYVYARSLSACRRACEIGEQAGAGAREKRRPRAADALFVHVPPFSALGEEAQRGALLDLLQALVEQLKADDGIS